MTLMLWNKSSPLDVLAVNRFVADRALAPFLLSLKLMKLSTFQRQIQYTKKKASSSSNLNFAATGSNIKSWGMAFTSTFYDREPICKIKNLGSSFASHTSTLADFISPNMVTITSVPWPQEPTPIQAHKTVLTTRFTHQGEVMQQARPAVHMTTPCDLGCREEGIELTYTYMYTDASYLLSVGRDRWDMMESHGKIVSTKNNTTKSFM